MNTGNSRLQSIKAIPRPHSAKPGLSTSLRRLLWIGILTIPLFALASCGGGGGGSSGAKAGKWDQMKWDQGKWG